MPLRFAFTVVALLGAALLVSAAEAELTAEEFTKLPLAYKTFYAAGYVAGFSGAGSWKCDKPLTAGQIIARVDSKIAAMQANGVMKPGNQTPISLMFLMVFLPQGECVPVTDKTDSDK